MSYTPPSIGSAGLATPTFNDILGDMIQQFQQTFGANVYLGNDSPDFQDLSIRALQVFEVMQALQTVYLSMNPLTAIGASLDLNGKLIGTARKTASFSTAALTITGTPGTVITLGQVRDINQKVWALPASVTIPNTGTTIVIVTCTDIGNITANPGDISIIATPTAGWTGATNLTAAVPGQPVEPDSAYRARLLLSQAKPSQTLLEGTAAAIAAVSGVTRSVVYENPTGATASFGLVSVAGDAVTLVIGYPFDDTQVGQNININGTVYPITAYGGPASLTIGSSIGTLTDVPFFIGAAGSGGIGVWLGPRNSITAVVEGGSAADIAQAIYGNRGIGPYTNGTTTITVASPLNPAITMPISFYVLAYTPIYVTMNVRALTGYTTATTVAIQAAIVAYLNSLGIGETVVFSELYAAAAQARPNPDQPLFSIRAVQAGASVLDTTGTTTLGSPSLSALASTTGIVIGQTVTGAGIPAGTTVSAIPGGGVVTMSNNATANGVAAPVSFFSLGTSDIPVLFNFAAQGAPINVLINLV